MKAKRTQKSKGEKPIMTFKSDKFTDFVYKLNNGSEITFKSKQFPINGTLETNNGQLLLF